ncbi:MAG: beta-ketoacyl-ACP reductase [Candidatus Micrarchaeia archaeon]|jgi:NAD(P)-dependent dehydrogenase (short-subunit alcohol dehydrogenase family)
MDKIAVVTGGAKGIGKATCDALSKNFKVVALDLKFESPSDSQIECDVSDPTAVKEAFAKILAQHGRIDVLVNNAGIISDSALENMTLDQWNKVLSVNLTSMFLCCKEAVPAMKKNRGGRIINVASVMGETGNRGQANYAASKAGVIGFTKSLAKELAFFGITSNAVSPGFIETDLTKNVPDAFKKDVLSRIPLRRFGSPKDVAAAIAFLASEDAAYMTGQVLRVDGGYL